MEKLFLDNWLKILNFNKKYSPSEGEFYSEQVRLPFTPIRIEAKLLYNISKLLYSRFINDQQNIVDLIISNDEEDILKIFFYNTDTAGIHKSFKDIDPDIIKLRKYPIQNIDTFFDELQDEIYSQTNSSISHIRIMKDKALKLINNLIENIGQLSLRDFIKKFIDVFQHIVENELFYIYPEPNIMNFLKEIINFLADFKLSNIFSYLIDLLPKLNISIILFSEEFTFIIIIRNEKDKSNLSNLNFQILLPEELELEFKNLKENQIIKLVHKTFAPYNTFLFYQNHILKIIEDLFELEIPLDINKIKLILQKLLYGYRSFEINWYRDSRPIIYNPILRWIIRIMGVNYNLKKFSHWGISEFIFNNFNLNFGLNSKIIVIFTDLQDLAKKNIKNIEKSLRIGFQKAVLFQIENNALTNIESLLKNDILKNSENFSLKHIRNKLSKKYGFISAVISVDKKVIESFFNKIIFKFSRFTLFSKISLIRTFRKTKYFDIYPKVPIYTFLKKTQYFYMIKTFLQVFIDKYEF